MSARRDRRGLIAAAHAVIAGRSPALAFASQLLDRGQRERSWLLFAWCRACDDLVRGADPEAALEQIRAKTDTVLNGGKVDDARFDALALLLTETTLPPRYPRLAVDGLAMDVADFRPRDEEELFRYCHHVAGAPAAMAAIAMGVGLGDAAMLERAGDLGIGCRLAALARDISEDAAAGRCYLPDDWLSEMDIPPGEHMKPPYRKRLAVLAERLADRAETFIASACRGVPDLPFRPAWAVLTIAAIHRDILSDVVARGEHGWDHRTSSSRADRIDKAMLAGFAALTRRWVARGGAIEPPWRYAGE
jgi:phytoene synthase